MVKTLNHNQKSKFFKTFYFLVAISVFGCLIFSFVGAASAQENIEYKVLTALPGIGDEGDGTTTLEKYVPAIFQIAVGLAAVFAVLMIVLGGIQYMSSDAFYGKEDGKNRAWSAVKGLLFVIAAYLILYTINPNLLEFNLNIETIKIAEPPAGTLTPTNINQLAATCPNCSPIRDDLHYSLSPAYLAQVSCPTCVGFHQNIPAGGNTNVNILPGTNDRLDLFQKEIGSGLSWYVSEAWPPTVVHQNPCHAAGSCVDMSLGSTAATSANVNKVIDSAYSSGLVAIYEVKADGDRQDLVNAGVPADHVIVVPTINNNHFSVYNCFDYSTGCANIPQGQP